MSEPTTVAFFEAVRAGEVGAVRAALDADPALVRAPFPGGLSPRATRDNRPLHEAVAFGQAEVAALLLDRGAEIDARNEEGRTALHDSIELGHRQVTELLLARGAEVDVCAAAILGHLERLTGLLDGDPALANDRSTKLSPLGWAAYGNQVEAARLLLARGARLDDGELLCAASVGQVEVGRVLLEHGADPNEVHAGCGGTALHAAALMQYTCDASAFVTMLLEAGADPSARSRSGRTALQIAEQADAAQQTLLDRPDGERPEFVRDYAGVAALLRRAAPLVLLALALLPGALR